MMVPSWAIGTVVVLGVLFIMGSVIVGFGMWAKRRSDRERDQ